MVLVISSSYAFACSNLLDTGVCLLDSSEKINLCEYVIIKVMLAVNVATLDVVIHISMLHYKNFMKHMIRISLSCYYSIKNSQKNISSEEDLC